MLTLATEPGLMVLINWHKTTPDLRISTNDAPSENLVRVTSYQEMKILNLNSRKEEDEEEERCVRVWAKL